MDLKSFLDHQHSLIHNTNYVHIKVDLPWNVVESPSLPAAWKGGMS